VSLKGLTLEQFKEAFQNFDLMFTFNNLDGECVNATGISSVLTTILDEEQKGYELHYFSETLNSLCEIVESGGTVCKDEDGDVSCEDWGRKVCRKNTDPQIMYDAEHTQQFVDEQLTRDEQFAILLEFTEQFVTEVSITIDLEQAQGYLRQIQVESE